MATVLKTVSPDEVEKAAMAFLERRPAFGAVHSKSSLGSHLRGVYDLLRRWQCRDALCYAGLYHSVYGTQHFRTQAVPLTERPDVQVVIGDEAERLAFEFCRMDTGAFVAAVRQDLSRADATLTDGEQWSAADKLDLLHVFVANWLEQMPRMKPIQQGMHTELFRSAKSILLPLAADEIERVYGFDRAPEARLTVTAAQTARTGEGAIEILDDFVPAHLRHSLAALTERNIWRYGWKASATQTAHHFWHSHFGGDDAAGDETSCEGDLLGRPLIKPVVDLWSLLRERLGSDHVPVRVYANGHTYGGDGHMHTDSDRPGHFTALYYAHPEWQSNWGGETMFFDPSGRDVVSAVHPLPGRLVLFSGNIPHAARSPARDCPALRAVIVIKTFSAAAASARLERRGIGQLSAGGPGAAASGSGPE